MLGFTAKSGIAAFQQGAIGSVGTQPKRDPKSLLDHVFSFLGEMRQRDVIPQPNYRLSPRWVCRLMHTPYASVKELDLKFLKAAVHCDSYLRVIGCGFIDYVRLENRPHRQACINLLYEAVSLVNGEDPVWYTHGKPDPKDEHNEYVLELNANLEFNRILFGEEASHLGPLHTELPAQFVDDPGLSSDDKRYTTVAESNEHRKKLRYTLKSFQGVIPDVSHSRYVSLMRKREDQTVFDSLIRPIFDKLVEKRKEFSFSGYPVGKPPDGFDEVIRKGVPNAFAGEFYAVELLCRYRRYLRLIGGEPLPEFIPPVDAHGSGSSGFILTHLRVENKSPPSVLVDTLRANAVSPQMIVDILNALGAKERTIGHLYPGIPASEQAGPLALLFTIAKEDHSLNWASCERVLLESLLPPNLKPDSASKRLAWNELQLAKSRAVELLSEAELLRTLKGSRVLEFLR